MRSTANAEILATFRHLVILIVASAILLASALGGWLVQRALAPLRTMSRSIALIDAERLHGRTGKHAWPADFPMVSDTGSRIGAKHLPHERFYRFDPARSSGEDAGLGLAVVESIVELHGGEVRVESETSCGARFILSLRAALKTLP